MTSRFPLGPSDEVPLERELNEGDSGRPQELLLLPDAGNALLTAATHDTPIYYALPKVPTVVRSEAGQPEFSLQVMLSRMPSPEEENIRPLVERGHLTFRLDLGVSDDVLEQLADCDDWSDVEFRRLFAREITAALRSLDADDEPLAASIGAGAAARLAFSARLDRAQTLDVLDSLDGEQSSLSVSIDVTYRATLVERSRLKPASSNGLGSAYASTTIVEETTPTAVLRTLSLTAPLDALFGGLLEGEPLDRYIRLLAVPQGELAPREVARRERAKNSRTTPSEMEPVPTALLLNEAVAMPTMLEPDSTPETLAYAHLLAHQPEPGLIPELTYWQAHDFVTPVAEDEPPQSLPVVDNPNAPLWQDRLNPNQFWYAPQFRLIEPNASDDPRTSAFRFQFTQVGHDVSGNPGLEGTIHFTLRQIIGEATLQALAERGNPPASPVPILSLSASLAVPFRNEHGSTATSIVTAEVTQDGSDVLVTVRLLDDWVRLAYGALAIKGFQPQSARIVVSYCYQGYGQSPTMDFVFMPHDIGIPIWHEGDPEPVDPYYFDATNLVLHHDNLRIDYLPELLPTNVQPGVLPTGFPEGSHFRPLPPDIVVAPNVLTRELLPAEYSRQTFGVNQGIDASFPCNTFGAFYMDITGGATDMIGCSDAFALGHTVYRQYERLDDNDLQNPYCTVYRSLQQVGVFLIVPRRYCVTRFEPDEGDRAYRPVMYLYSITDLGTSGANRCDFAMTLQPDMPRYVERNLRAKLERRARNPILRYFTEAGTDVTYTWSITEVGSFTVTPKAIMTWNGFQVTLSTTLVGALQVQAMLQHTGITALAHLNLPDGTTLPTTLQIDLNAIVGPWQAGPLEIATEGDRLRLTNRIERSVNLSDVRLYAPNGSTRALAVDTMLAAGESCQVALPAGVTTQWAIEPVYTLAPGDAATLEEIRSFIEDIRLNVIFVNLVDLAGRGLNALRIEVRLQNWTPNHELEPLTAEQPTRELRIVLPLTQYLAAQVLEFRVGKVATDGTEMWTDPISWSLTSSGHIISLRSEMLFTSRTNELQKGTDKCLREFPSTSA